MSKNSSSGQLLAISHPYMPFRLRIVLVTRPGPKSGRSWLHSMGRERMLIFLDEDTDPPADGPVVARDTDGTEHELTIVVRAGMVCIHDQEHEDCAYVMHTGAALQLGLQLIRAGLATRQRAAVSLARPDRLPH